MRGWKPGHSSYSTFYKVSKTDHCIITHLLHKLKTIIQNKGDFIMTFFDRVKRGAMMGLIAYQYIMDHKKVLLYTIISTCLVAFTCAVGVSAFAGFALIQHHAPHHNGAVGMLLLLISVSLATLFINAYLHVALSYYVANQFENKEVGFFESLWRALHRIFTIIAWVLLTWTVGVLLSRSDNQRGIGAIIMNVISSALSLGWKVLTFFVIPIIALQDLGIIKTIEQSGRTMEKTFGQNVGATFALGAANFVLFSVVSALCWGPTYLLWQAYLPAHNHYGAIPTIPLILIILLALLPFFIVIPITSAAKIIFQVASYHYAINKPTGPFDPHMIAASFTTQKE